MEIVKSIRISLTMDDIIDNVSQLTKQQIIEKFRLLLDRKQLQINEKIQHNNAQHLLVLQKKMLILERKDDQIVKLNNTISTYKNQLHDEKNKSAELQQQALQNKLKAIHYEKKYNEYDSIYKQQKSKREKLKKQYQKLQTQLKTLSQQHTLQVRTHKKLKEQKTNWQQQTQLLLNNLKKHQEQEQHQKIKNLQLNFDNKIAQISELHQQMKIKYENYKQKYIQAKNNVNSLNKTLELINKQLINQKIKYKKNNSNKVYVDVNMQTGDQIMEEAYLLGRLFKKEFFERLQNRSQVKLEVKVGEVERKQCKDGEVQTMELNQCQQCKQLKTIIQTLENEIKILKPKQKKNQKPRILSIASQTNPPVVKYYCDQISQTVFKPLPKEEEQQLLQNLKVITRNSERMIENWKIKYEQMEKMFVERPSKLEDRQKIGELQRNMIEMEIRIMSKNDQIQSLMKLISQLNHKISEQTALLNQFNIQDVQIRSIATKNTRPRSQPQQNLSVLNRRSHIRIESKNQSSFTISIRESRNNKSLSPRISSKNRNYSNSSNILTQKNQTESVSPQGKYNDNNGESFKSMLIEKGITFKPKSKDIGDQLSDVRQYKKYKGSLKKVRL